MAAYKYCKVAHYNGKAKLLFTLKLSLSIYPCNGYKLY